MEFEYKGGNCVVVTTKQATIVTDPNLSSLGLKDVQPKNAIDVLTQNEFVVSSDNVSVDQPGEYDVSNVSIVGVPAKRLIDEDDDVNQATMYRMAFSDATVGVIGHVTTPLSEEQLEKLGLIDILILPVGGNGYTLDAHHAVAVVRQIDPRVVIPTYYADKDVKYPVAPMALEDFVKELGVAHEVLPKWKIKNGVLPETLTVMELTRTS